MDFTIKQINRLLSIQELLETVNTLYKVYNDYDYKELSKETLADKQRIYQVYCSSLYNLIKAIKDSKDFFNEEILYKDFEELINKKYVADDNRYYSKENYESTLYKIIGEIRHKCNHFEKDDNDEMILFEAFIDFEQLNILRELINTMFYEVYSKIDKQKIKKIILSRPKVMYGIKKINEKVEEVDAKILEINKNVSSAIEEENIKTMLLFKRLFNPDVLYGLLLEDESAINEFNNIDMQYTKNIIRYEKEINEKGTKSEKESFKLLKKFLDENEFSTLEEYKQNINKFMQEMKEKE